MKDVFEGPTFYIGVGFREMVKKVKRHAFSEADTAFNDFPIDLLKLEQLQWAFTCIA